jgi:hypothetical protein
MASRAYEQSLSNANRKLWAIWCSAIAALVLLGMFGLSITDSEVPMTLPLPFRMAIFGAAALMGGMSIAIPRHALSNRVLMEHVRSKSRSELTTGKANSASGGMTPREERLSALGDLYARPFIMSIALGETVGLLGLVYLLLSGQRPTAIALLVLSAALHALNRPLLDGLIARASKYLPDERAPAAPTAWPTQEPKGEFDF